MNTLLCRITDAKYLLMIDFLALKWKCKVQEVVPRLLSQTYTELSARK